MSHQYIDISTDFKKVSDEFHKLTMYPADVWTWKHLAYYFKNLSVTAASIVEHQDLQAVTDLGNTTTNSITVNGVTSPYYLLDTTATPTPQQGMLFWDEDRSTVGLQMNGVEARLGQDNFWYVKNQTGSPIPKGTAVMAVGALGASSRILVAPMVADGSVDEQYFLGITAEEILNGEDGFVTNIGKIRGIDTRVYGTQAGQILYCDPANPGGFTITQPQAPNLNIPAAFTVDYKNNGTIAVRALPGYHLSELHDVYINTPSDQDILLYNGTNNRWENTPLASAVPTPTLDQVTTAGNTTTNDITVGGLTVDTDLIYTDTVNGRVGIGTTTPSYKFHLVDSNTSVGGSYASPFYLSISRSSSGGSPLATYFTQEIYTLSGTDTFSNSLGKQIYANINNTGNSIYRNLMSRVHTARSGGANHIALYSTQFEGLGTGTINNFYGTVIGNSAVSGFSNVNSTITNTYGLYFGSLTSGTQTNAPYAIYQSGTEKNYFAGNVLIGTTTDAGYKLDVNGTIRSQNDAYFATTSGNVGIGTTTPQQLLDITDTNAAPVLRLSRNQNIYSWVGESLGDIEFYTNDPSYAQVYGKISVVGGPNSGTPSSGYPDGHMVFSTAGQQGGSLSEKMRITDEGNVGIGTTTPSYKLDVNGDVNSNGDYYNNGIQGYTGTVTIQQTVPNPPINIDINGGIITNVY